MMSSRLTAEERAQFKTLADYLVPATAKMPSASQVGAHEALLDEVLDARPDLLDGLKRGIAACAGKPAGPALNALLKEAEADFQALSLCASGAYYMAPKVREALGYPGQGNAPYEVQETPAYLTNGMIERVVRRGPLYKPTPRD